MSEQPDPNEIASVSRLCRESGAPRRQVVAAIAAGELVAYAFPYARPYCRRSEFYAWLESHRTPAAAEPLK